MLGNLNSKLQEVRNFVCAGALRKADRPGKKENKKTANRPLLR